MKRIGDKYWYLLEESRKMLFTILPNYPDLSVVNPVPTNMYPPENVDCEFPKE